MTFRYSKPFEELLENHDPLQTVLTRVNTVIVGSGYGGAVAAYRLAHPNRGGDDAVMVLERGREYALGEFPTTVEDMPGFVRAVHGGHVTAEAAEDSLFDFRIGEGVDVLVGSGLGGTSLINANVAIRPDAGSFRHQAWPTILKQEAADPGSPLNRAYDRVEEWLVDRDCKDAQTHAAQQAARLQSLRKFNAFQQYSSAMGFVAEPAPLAVNLGAKGSKRRNRAGVVQAACTDCGNCVTGCNVGAKNTLAMNLIPAAQQRGALFYTGAHVLRIERCAEVKGCAEVEGVRWRVHVQASNRETRVRYPGGYCIEAAVVILAAGALGSTEILQRSKIACSARLGHRFSTNGDALAVGFAGTHAVDALGQADQHQPATPCGPTISAVTRASTRQGERFTLEDGAFPAALVEVLGELIATTAQFGRLGQRRMPGWFATSGAARDAVRDPLRDPQGAHAEALAHSQLLLVMAQDSDAGYLSFDSRPGVDVNDRRVIPTWPTPAAGASASPVLENIEEVLSGKQYAAGMDHAQYVDNPLWRLMPDAAAGAMSGTFPKGRLLSVHPLGGCCIAECGELGVVNERGQVFEGPGTSVHGGLYVLDGAIIPAALGVNPFLTIAALAWRACEDLIHTPEASAGSLRTVKQPPVSPQVDRPKTAAAIIVKEQFVGGLVGPGVAARRQLHAALREFLPADRQDALQDWFKASGLVLRLETQPFELTQLDQGEGRIAVKLELHRNSFDAEGPRKAGVTRVPAASVHAGTRLAAGTGHMTFMRAAPPRGGVPRVARILAALWAYRCRRQRFWRLITDHLANTSEASSSWRARIASSYDAIVSMWNVAGMHATYRDFEYTMTLVGAPGRTLELTGRKRVAWRPGARRLWDALLHLNAAATFTASSRASRVAANVELVVDPEYLFGEGLVQIAPDSSVPAGIVSCLGFAARLARCAMQAGFWEFGAPDYPRAALKPEPDLPATLKCGAALESLPLTVPRLRPTDPNAQNVPNPVPAMLPLRLHVYRATVKRRNEPVLLLHGLAQGSLIFAHPAMKCSMAEFFAREGYDVWLLDYRLSNQLTAVDVAYDGDWSIDEIGAFDVPWAVHRIREDYDGQKVHLFAHCVGAIATTMAICQGKLTHEHLASVSLNAIHPWTRGSLANRVRVKLGTFARQWLDDSVFDPIIQKDTDVQAATSLIDRVAFSLARLGEGPEPPHGLKDGPGLSNAICDRMTFLYGRMWNHENVGALHPHWKDLVGRAPGSVQRHLYYLLIRGRVVNCQGVNEYLTEANLLKHWGGIRTLFVHGLDSQVFHPQSAVESAVRLKQIIGRADPSLFVGVKRFDSYGHMDVILAGDASKKSFPSLLALMQNDCSGARCGEMPPPSMTADHDAAWHAEKKLRVGPILRSARMERGRLVLRMWAEAAVDLTSRTAPVRWQSRNSHFENEREIKEDFENRYCWIDVDLLPEDYAPIRAHPQPIQPRAQPMPARAPAAEDGKTALDRFPWIARLVKRSDDCYFLVGSCRYPGTPFDESLANQAFAGMKTLLERGTPCDLLFLIGDQIYADATAGILDPTPWRERFADRYRSAFAAPSVREVLNWLPCHFAIDDHEFADNFAGPADHKGLRAARAIKSGVMSQQEFLYARGVASAYMDSGRSDVQFGGSSTVPAAGSRPPQLERVFWYALDDDVEVRCPVFILDTRSERRRAHGLVTARLMGDEQMHALLAWLESKQNDARPKFIVMGTPMLPLSKDFKSPGVWLRQDGLTGYREELSLIINHIVDHDIRQVVFVSGDPHLSCCAEMTLTNARGSVEALHIVSSGLYCPLPFANVSPDEVDWNVQDWITLDGCVVQYTPQLLASGAPHFLRVGATKQAEEWTITAEAFDREAKSILRKTYPSPLRTAG